MKTQKLIVTCLAVFAFSLSFLHAQKIVNKVILFEIDKYDINENYFNDLDSLCKIIADTEEYQLNLYGRADSTGFVDDNMILSKNRVETVVDYFISGGVDAEKIILDYYGEDKPLISEENTIDLSANRSVLISVLYVEEEKRTSETIWRDFEQDAIIETPRGTIIEIEAGAFFPHKIEDIEFEINEVYTICDILNNGSSLQTEDGNCLTSAGMLYVNPTFEGEEVQPKADGKVVLKIPMPAGQQFDPDMKLYYEDWDDENNSVWKEYDADLTFEQGQQSYYVFEIDEFRGMNIDKPFGLICQKTGPKIKVRKFKSADVCQIYPGEMYLSRGENIRRKTYQLDEVDLEKSPSVVILAYDRHGLPYLADEELVNLKYNKRKDRYVVKSKVFKLAGNSENQPEQILCGAINEVDGIVSSW